MRKHCCWLLLTCCASSLAAALPVQAEDRQILPTSAAKSPAPTQTAELREFEVRVDNKPTGTHRLTFKSRLETQTVEFQTDVKVDLFVYAYVFKFRGIETWRDGRVEETDIKCEDGGKKRSFTLKSDGVTQQMTFNGKPLANTARSIMTTAYWKLPSAELRTKAFTITDVDTGTNHSVTLQLVGNEQISVGGRNIACEHFKIDGPSAADLWFDDQGRLVRQKSLENGHAMELRLNQIRVLKDEN